MRDAAGLGSLSHFHLILLSQHLTHRPPRLLGRGDSGPWGRGTRGEGLLAVSAGILPPKDPAFAQTAAGVSGVESGW